MALLSVILAAHNPHLGRLQKTLQGLRQQTLSHERWELIVVDNQSQPAIDPAFVRAHAPPNHAIVAEPVLGLSSARRRGFLRASAPLAVLVDDDNVIAPDYLHKVLELFAAHPHVGVLGGKSLPAFESAPPGWMEEFHGLIACRDFGDTPLISSTQAPAHSYPQFSPIGAGMGLRREVFEAWLNDPLASQFTDRRGGELTSGGDNDIVFTALGAGWQVGYFPQLSLSHLIPPERTSERYLCRLNQAVQQSWMRVLSRHGANPFHPVAGWTVPLRKLKAWFRYRAWAGPAFRIRWRGACGHFDGRVEATGK